MALWAITTPKQNSEAYVCHIHCIYRNKVGYIMDWIFCTEYTFFWGGGEGPVRP